MIINRQWNLCSTEPVLQLRCYVLAFYVFYELLCLFTRIAAALSTYYCVIDQSRSIFGYLLRFRRCMRHNRQAASIVHLACHYFYAKCFEICARVRTTCSRYSKCLELARFVFENVFKSCKGQSLTSEEVRLTVPHASPDSTANVFARLSACPHASCRASWGAWPSEQLAYSLGMGDTGVEYAFSTSSNHVTTEIDYHTGPGSRRSAPAD